MNCPKCAEDGSTIELLAKAERKYPEGLLYCPACNGRFAQWQGIEAAPKVPRPEVGPIVHKLPFEMKAESTGFVLFTIDAGDRTLSWRLGPDDLKAMSDASSYMRGEVTKIIDRRSGKDQWSFCAGGGSILARIHDEERALSMFTVGQRREGRADVPCNACCIPIPSGSKAYRASTTGNVLRVVWSQVRFCLECVSKAIVTPEVPKVRPVLIVYQGGKGRASNG